MYTYTYIPAQSADPEDVTWSHISVLDSGAQIPLDVGKLPSCLLFQLVSIRQVLVEHDGLLVLSLILCVHALDTLVPCTKSPNGCDKSRDQYKATALNVTVFGGKGGREGADVDPSVVYSETVSLTLGDYYTVAHTHTKV